MTTSTMNISLPEKLKRFVRERAKSAHFSNPSDYVRSLIREDQRRVAAEMLLEELVAKHLAVRPATKPEELDELRAEYWARWIELKAEIDRGIASLDRGEGREFNRNLIEEVKRRGRGRLSRSRTR
jgi:Arc/MetJ-type ribon-helix-helix transcriptional regulator